MTMRARFFLPLLAGLALAARPAGAQFRVVPGEDCRDGGSWHEERYCEVREATLPAGHQPIRVDGTPNGGIHVEGWDRDEVRVRAKVSATGESEAEARAMAG